jgi:hypothetical protein
VDAASATDAGLTADAADAADCTTASPCVVTLASGQSTATALAVGPDAVYWVDWGDLGKADGTVMKVPLDGGTPVVLAPGRATPNSIAVDATSVYWTDQAANSVQGGQTEGLVEKLPLDGGTAVTLASGQENPGSIVVYGTNVYWKEIVGAVHSVPTGGGTPTTLASIGPAGYDLVVGATGVYWGDSVGPNGGSIMQMPLGGGTPTAIVSGTPSAPSGLALGPAGLYWTSSGDGTINMFGPGDTAPKTLASALSPASLVVDGDANAAYWASQTGADGSLWTLALAGGGTPTKLASSQNTPQSIAVDATSVYWIDQGSGSVMKLTPK